MEVETAPIVTEPVTQEFLDSFVAGRVLPKLKAFRVGVFLVVAGPNGNWRALVNVRAMQAGSGPAEIASTGKRGDRVGTCGSLMAVVVSKRTFVDFSADHAVARVSKIAGASKTA